jgi:CHASE2 domain
MKPSVLTTIRASYTWSRRAWGYLGHRNRHGIVNVLFGITIAIGLYGARNARIVVASQNWALDTAMQSSAAVHELHGGAVALTPMAFIDIDEETWRSPHWGNGEPFRAPRAGLLALMKYALDNNARYVVLDVIVEGGSDPENEWFAEEIEQQASRLKPDQHIFFVRTLREPLDGLRDLLAPELRSSSLDRVIKNHPKQLHAVAPYFRVSRDGVLRDWQMWRIGCRRDAGTGKGHWEILPSVQLAIGALLLSDKRSDDNHGNAEGAAFPWNKPAGVAPCIVDFASYMQVGVPVSKLRPDDDQMWDWLRDDSGLPNASEIEVPSDEALALNNRIFFRFRYRQELSDVRLISAQAILEHAPHSELAKDGVVVIGQSFEAARDQHATPLGVMPGPMVLINSLDSMLKPGLLREPGRANNILIEGTSIALVGFILAYLDYIIAFFVILTLFVPLLICINYLLLLSGIWVDFAIPLLGIYLHWIIVEIEAYASRRHTRTDTHVHRKGEN